MTARTVAADAAVRRGRLAKAEQFATAAADLRHSPGGAADLDDVYVTLCVHAGIAAADVICARKLGVHAQGQNHKESVVLLRGVDREAAGHLDTLLNMKTDAGYGHQPISNQKAVRAGRAMEALMQTARSPQ